MQEYFWKLVSINKELCYLKEISFQGFILLSFTDESKYDYITVLEQICFPQSQ